MSLEPVAAPFGSTDDLKEHLQNVAAQHGHDILHLGLQTPPRRSTRKRRKPNRLLLQPEYIVPEFKEPAPPRSFSRHMPVRHYRKGRRAPWRRRTRSARRYRRKTPYRKRRASVQRRHRRVKRGIIPRYKNILPSLPSSQLVRFRGMKIHDMNPSGAGTDGQKIKVHRYNPMSVLRPSVDVVDALQPRGWDSWKGRYHEYATLACKMHIRVPKQTISLGTNETIDFRLAFLTGDATRYTQLNTLTSLGLKEMRKLPAGKYWRIGRQLSATNHIEQGSGDTHFTLEYHWRKHYPKGKELGDLFHPTSLTTIPLESADEMKADGTVGTDGWSDEQLFFMMCAWNDGNLAAYDDLPNFQYEVTYEFVVAFRKPVEEVVAGVPPANPGA